MQITDHRGPHGKEMQTFNKDIISRAQHFTNCTSNAQNDFATNAQPPKTCSKNLQCIALKGSPESKGEADGPKLLDTSANLRAKTTGKEELD